LTRQGNPKPRQSAFRLDHQRFDGIGEEHRAAARVSLSGTHLGPLMGLPASGKYMTLSLHEFHNFREGRISVTRHMEDWMGVFRQIGALPPAL
jgi:predicted ester cyclase